MNVIVSIRGLSRKKKIIFGISTLLVVALIAFGVFIAIGYNQHITAINAEMSNASLRGQPPVLTQQSANFQGQDDSFAAQTGIDKTEYRNRALTAEKLDFFVHELKSQSPDSYAGTWIDQKGKAFIAVTDKSLLDLSPEGVTYTLVERNEAQLLKLLEETRDWVIATPSIQNIISAIAIDPRQNDVAVYVGDGVDTVQVPSYLANVRTEVLQLSESSEGYASKPLASQTNVGMGGDGYGVTAKSERITCSTGFNGTSTEGKPVIFTSAYCQSLIKENTQLATPLKLFANGTFGANLGSFVASGRNDNSDYAVIAVNDAMASRYTTASIRSSEAPLQVSGVSIPIVGMPVCKSGIETGVSCGYITTANAFVPLGLSQASPWANWTDSFLTSACAGAGDRGGPLMSGTKAVGVMTSLRYGSDCQLKQDVSVYSQKASAAYSIDAVIQKVSDSYQLNIAG